MPNSTIFTASANEKERVLFSVQERASGDLTLILKHAEFDRPPGGGLPTEDDRLIEERLSIHRSLDSPTINAMKYTKVYKTGVRRYSRHYTNAVKLNSLFSPIFIRRAGNLAAPRFDLPVKGAYKSHSIGPFSPTHSQPLYMVFVGPPFTRFCYPYMDPQTVNMMQIPFKYFTLIILWQFLFYKGAESASAAVFTTLPLSNLLDKPYDAFAMAYMQQGISAAQALDLFAKSKYEIARQHFERNWALMSSEYRAENLDIHQVLLEFDCCLKSGMADSLEYKRYFFRVFHPLHPPDPSAPRWNKGGIFRVVEDSTS